MKNTGKVFRWHYVHDLCVRHGWNHGAELGVSDGKFTHYLVKTLPELRMISVDLWSSQPGNDGKPGGESYETWDHEKSYREFLEKIEPHKDRVTVHRMPTSAAASRIGDESLDFVFIDACHAFDCVVEDIRSWEPKVKTGGMVIGHDWPWPSVRNAVESVYPKERIIIGPNKCWAVWK